MHASETVQITVTFHLINDVILNCFSVADPGFDGQGQPHRWAHNLSFGDKFPETA